MTNTVTAMEVRDRLAIALDLGELDAATRMAERVAPWAGPPLRLLIVAGGLAQVLGTLLFVVNMWWRVRMPTVPTPPGR